MPMKSAARWPIALFPLQHHRKRHEDHHRRLQPRVFAQQNCHVSHERDISDHTPHNILAPVQVILPTRIKLRVISGIVISLREKLQRRSPVIPSSQHTPPRFTPSICCRYSPSPKPSNNPMHNRNILPTHIIHHNLAHLRLDPSIPQKQQIPPLEGWLHAAGEDYDDGRGGVGED